MKLLDRLLDAAVAALPEDLRAHVVIFGSAPMVFAGLKPDVKNDLDLFVSDQTFGRLFAAGFSPDEQRPDVPRIALATDVEVFKTWLGVTFPETYAASAACEGSRGLRVASLHHVLAFKLASNREKDQPDISILQQAIRR
jgi:hypothetical protein